MTPLDSETQLLNFEPVTQTFLDDVLTGLNRRPRSLPCKYFYDERGSQLFDQICQLPEYYLTRTELAIMRQYADEMAEQIGPGVMLIEYGSGASTKTRLLLERLRNPAAYVPVDISRKHLLHSAAALNQRFPAIEVLPVCADFTEDFELPIPEAYESHNAVYFPGSTIGNFTPTAAGAMLRQLVDLCGCGGGLLIGVDLQKDPQLIEAAYNDSQGVTAAFNLNLLERINRELKGDVEVDQFEHRAVYNKALGRVEISLVSRVDQTMLVGNRSFHIRRGEQILTEYSHKYTVAGFAQLAGEAGLSLRRYWTDPQNLFAVLHFAILN